jgi:hypothetical protein
LAQALEAIDTTPSPAHFLDIRIDGLPIEPVSINRLKRTLQKWIADLPDDKTSRTAAPFVYEEHSLKITLIAWHRNNKARVKRSIGVRHYPVREVTHDDNIRFAVEAKASRYGALGHPYLVAVNAFGFHLHGETIKDAILGTACHIDRQMHDGSWHSGPSRQPDGVWHNGKRPRKQGLSAVLVTGPIGPWNFASRRGLLFRNPWANRFLPPLDLGVDELNPINGRWRPTEGTLMGTLVGLRRGWPGD